MPFVIYAFKRMLQSLSFVSLVLLFIFIVFGHTLPNAHTWFIALTSGFAGGLLGIVSEMLLKQWKNHKRKPDQPAA